MTKDEIKHINWMYNRLTSVHKENPNFDYMKRFKEIIDKQLTLYDVSGSFSEKQMEEAWTDGCGCGESRSGFFDVENYR